MRKLILILLLLPLYATSQQEAEKTHELSEVRVLHTGAATALRQSVQQVTVVDAKKYYSRPSGAIDILGQASGIRIRQDGGLGSRADFAVNGISGKQVKLFIDGIPASYFGAGASLNTLPVNTIDRLEIYKGVVPVHLGADALGGAINIVTRQQLSNYLEATYALSSFHTQRVTVNARYRLPRNVFVNTTAFYNYSRNNYGITAEVPNQFGNPVQQKVKRFHDRFSNYYTAVELGITGKKWADLASLTLNASGIGQQVQHNVVMTQPYGKVTYAEQVWNSFFKYNKYQVLPGVDVQLFGGAGYTRGHFIDTSFNAYAWDGTVVNRRSYGGEISSSRNNLLLHTINSVARLLLSYTPDTLTRISFNVTGTSFHRKGEDTVAAAFYGQDFYTSPTRMHKLVTGISAERHTPQRKWTSLTAIKWYYYSATGFTVENAVLQTASNRMGQWGAAQSFRHVFNPSLAARFSYEYATRLPDELEVFGDYALTKASPGLQPEKSHNLNLSAQYTRSHVRAEVTGFYRRLQDIIYLRTSQFFAKYQNLLQAQITGIEGECTLQPWPLLQFTGNATWQRILNKSRGSSSGTTDDRYYNLQLPNMPWLMGNAGLQYTQPHLFRRGNTLTCWYNAAYVHRFYLYWANDGRADQKATIPGQYIQQAGLSYTWLHNRYTASCEMQNLANARAYDNFNVQKPGRSIHLKLKVFIP
ncbi:outer membrane cobalamin receptor [Filimonas zeae]|uniref:TonB-dependent receptor n=1 Tax=Filimonas zeae TaxID=1737353 RepID=A0A917MX86_9BACT|nr:TonB-dependent receptor [Filimonas zeae]MDR6340529.1 outer membrane cobalamin receptor [Filimonas zeae]GGH73170.1 TonB-dependent receptor [Filimonas zeae]